MAILVTTDGSPRSLEVLGHAAAFARATGNSLHLFRVLDPLLDVEISTQPAADAIAAVSQRWQDEMSAQMSALGVAGDTSVRVLPSGRKVHNVICRAATELGADMIALSSHGAGLIRHTVLGSVAMGVVGETELPLMVAGPKAEAAAPGDPYRVVVGNDGSDASGTMLRALAALPGVGRLNVVLLRVVEPRVGDRGDAAERSAAERELRELRTAFADGMEVRTVVERLRQLERIDHAIIRKAEELKADAIALTTHGYTRARHLFAGSVTVGALQHSRLPLIVVRSA
jgi:nucleotide-binding universal stress UspA family protein